ncbi:hypothetical protein [Mucilaginibacter sp. KACC 22063]|uniref:hypothetical protein n=1 Tax=Mucilaginibacter sp. KACC 22063 TaxID=3025666 RepID=UPI0023655750|nr:hypothetical protein [Mucilaginibacter sp. KACC 22063]WDF57199.1 hypothetical protein PQ461_09045 [Mucilaginibacter sp. KACC 22063]
MLSEEQKQHFASLRVEILDLDVCVNFFIRKYNRFAYLWQETSRAFILEEMIALRYLENGIILHLTNLDDDSSKYSFREAYAVYARSNISPTAARELKETLKTFRKNLNELKSEHRNKRIGHLNYDEDLNFDEFLDFENHLLPLILEANEIADKLWGEKIVVRFRLGSMEGTLDFKEKIQELKRNTKLLSGFYSNRLMSD